VRFEPAFSSFLHHHHHHPPPLLSALVRGPDVDLSTELERAGVPPFMNTQSPHRCKGLQNTAFRRCPACRSRDFRECFPPTPLKQHHAQAERLFAPTRAKLSDKVQGIIDELFGPNV